MEVFYAPILLHIIIYMRMRELSDLYAYRILSSERTSASSFLIPCMARQLRMMLNMGNMAANLRRNVAGMMLSTSVYAVIA